MCVDNCLIIDGEGYLDKVTVKGDKAIAEICCVDPTVDIANSDESLWVQGHIVSEAVKKTLLKFNEVISVGGSVKLRFKARYQRVGFLHYCSSNDDPEQIVGLKAELLFVREVSKPTANNTLAQ